VVNESDFIFLSIPTPANPDGSINLDIVDEALSSVNDVIKRNNIILLRSTMIPGSTKKFQKKYPNGNFGFGGVCFPKDILAMIDLGKILGVEMHTLKGAWKTNLEVRPDKDWEKLEGQAIVKK
tara:strand:- start:1833 stop:2201 length:369 start_codon:yes stop_codon:yes gene_type:complete